MARNREQVDVILPFTKLDNFLLEALDSIHESEDIYTRLILVDNSPHGILREFLPLRKQDLFLREEKLGFAQAVNAPFEQQIQFSRYVAIMNSDDISHPKRLVSQVRALQNADADISLCKVKNFRANREHTPFFGEVDMENYHPLYLIFGGFGIEPMWCATSTWWNENARRREDCHHDVVDLACALASFGKSKIVSVDTDLYFYRKHRKQLSKTMATLSSLEDIREEFKILLGTYGLPTPATGPLFYARPHALSLGSIGSDLKEGTLEFMHLIRERLVEMGIPDSAQHKIDNLIKIRIAAMTPLSSGMRLLSIRSRDLIQKRPI